MSSREHSLPHQEPKGPVDRSRLRNVLSRYATGVTVITAMTELGPVGMTANSFSSVSLDPPLVLFSVSRASQLSSHLTESGSFAVNVLSTAQKDLSAQFARPGFNRFGDTEWYAGRTSCPLFPGALAVVECSVTAVYEGGDHLITVGQVLGADSLESADSPLLFFGGAYREMRCDVRDG
ncbi:flavin reductase family protein [Streptomyces parvus]|uniref:flavin reductase family protein n=1 Tax=Streptomyces parvus TaxID=66428 RepID=UPI0036BBE978